MEKYRKFDDKSCGINPFTPHIPEKKLEGWRVYARKVISVLLVCMRLPALIMVFSMYHFFALFKYVLLIPYLVRKCERVTDAMFFRMILNTSSFNNFAESLHRDDKDFDFVKFQKGTLEVKETDADVYVCNQTSFAEWFWLHMKYSPIFTKAVVVEKGKERKVGLRVLGYVEMLLHAVGIKFPEIVTEDQSYIYYSIKEMRESAGFLCHRSLMPVVVFPECTKTNGNGILNLEMDIVRMIGKAAHPDENLRIHALRFDHIFEYHSPYNTHDETGIKYYFTMLTQFTAKLNTQYYQNIGGVIYDCQNDQDKHDFLQKALMPRKKEKSMKNSDWRTHQEFIKYWNDTQSGKEYSKKNQ